MNNQYFTPEIEDIRVGYDCEHTSAGSFDNDEIIKDKLTESEVARYLEWSLTSELKDMIRVPYLTKEQIEAEGWEMKGGGLSENLFGYQVGTEETEEFKKRKARYDFIDKYLIFGAYTIFWKGDYRLEYFFQPYCPKKNWIQICVNPSWPSYELKQDIYMGECKDINSFRYICKLLNIK